MNYKLVVIALILVYSLHISFSTDLILELEEGGCSGYENGLVQAYYSNETLINSSEFEVTIYEGPLEGMGILTQFETSDEPHNVLFEEPTDYLYEIEPDNSSLYDETSGYITIYKCDDRDNQNNDQTETFLLETQGNIISQVTYESGEIDLITQEQDENERKEFTFNFEDTRIDPQSLQFVELVFQNRKTTDNNITFDLTTSDFDSQWILRENDTWRLLDQPVEKYNVSVEQESIILALQKNSSSTTINSQDSNSQEPNQNTQEEEDPTNEVVNEEVEEDPTSQSQNSEESTTSEEINTSSSNTIEEESSFISFGMVFNYIITIVIVILIFIVIIYSLFAMQDKNKNVSKVNAQYRKKKEEAPKTILEEKILKFIEQNKDSMEPPQVIEELVKQGYDKDRVIEILWDYIEKNNKN